MQSPTGKKIIQELKILVNEIHAKSPNKKMLQGPFKNRISTRLKELGVESNHTDAYLRDMNKFYKAIYELNMKQHMKSNLFKLFLKLCSNSSLSLNLYLPDYDYQFLKRHVYCLYFHNHIRPQIFQ
jgi:hypothetical protein